MILECQDRYVMIFKSILVFSFAVSVNFLFTVDLSGNFVRVSSSDFLLPFIFIFILYHFWDSKTFYSFWYLERIWKWLFLISLWMTFCLVNGYFFTGGVQTWGLINKYIGWYILVVFFIFGGVVSSCVSQKLEKTFFTTVFITSFLIGVCEFFAYFHTMRGLGNYFRVQGFSGNPNAYGFLVVVLVLCLFSRQVKENIISKEVDILGFGILIAMIAFCGSRSAWISLGLGMLSLFLTRSIKYTFFVYSLLISISLIMTAVYAQDIENTYKRFFADSWGESQNNVYPYFTRPNILEDSGVNHRIKIMHNANQLWLESPVTGVGLGGFIWSEMREGRSSTIHMTAQWLLVETGLVGLFLFIGFFADIIWHFWNRIRKNVSRGRAVIGITLLISFVGASMGFEAMYQRHLWFFAGWALARTNWRDSLEI